jgi:hypothetical protein
MIELAIIAYVFLGIIVSLVIAAITYGINTVLAISFDKINSKFDDWLSK